MSEPNYSVDPIFDSEDEWDTCYECTSDYIREDKHGRLCPACKLKEEEAENAD